MVISFILALPIAPVIELFEKYVFGDWEFVKYLVILMIIDTALGFTKHYIAHDLSSKAWGQVARKVMVYACALILAHVMSSFTVDGNTVDTFVWFRYFACSVLMVREALSIVENVEEIAPGFFPKAIVTKLKEFDSVTGHKRREREINQ